jgi:hypothetical protein
VAPAGLEHLAQRLGADLVAEAPRAAVDRDQGVALREPEGLGRRGVVDLRDLLHLEVVVAGAERPDLVAHARLGALGHRLRPRVRHLAALLDALQVARLAVALLDRPARAAAQHRSISSWPSRMRPLLPTPAGIARKSVSASSFCRATTSSRARRVLRQRTPQEMSNPTPPAETMPSSGSKAATPPTVKP